MSMTVALRVDDGIVLAADSASTVSYPKEKVNVYFHQQKVFRLHTTLPLGMVTWGLNRIAADSMPVLAGYLCRRFSGQDATHADWKLDPQSYTVKKIADEVRRFFFDETYLPWIREKPRNDRIGIVVAGFPSGTNRADLAEIEIHGAHATGPKIAPPRIAHVNLGGQWGPVGRLVLGYDNALKAAMAEENIPPAKIDAVIKRVGQMISGPIFHPGMPIPDAVELAEFLVRTAITYCRFAPDPDTVAGPVQIATITKHEGFRWAKRGWQPARE